MAAMVEYTQGWVGIKSEWSKQNKKPASLAETHLNSLTMKEPSPFPK